MIYPIGRYQCFLPPSGWLGIHDWTRARSSGGYPVNRQVGENTHIDQFIYLFSYNISDKNTNSYVWKHTVMSSLRASLVALSDIQRLFPQKCFQLAVKNECGRQLIDAQARSEYGELCGGYIQFGRFGQETTKATSEIIIGVFGGAKT